VPSRNASERDAMGSGGWLGRGELAGRELDRKVRVQHLQRAIRGRASRRAVLVAIEVP
jgi:hypothetical protein